MVATITETELRCLYYEQKVSPAQIGPMLGITQRNVYNLFKQYGIKSLGASHLRKGKSATWNVGRIRSEECKRKNALAHAGQRPHNLGYGDAEFACEVCGKTVAAKPYRKCRTCGADCWTTLVRGLRGEGHWNYIGDEQRAHITQRCYSQYREWRKQVMRACQHSCVKCGASHSLHAHHLNNWKAFPDRRFDAANGIALCTGCHRTFHNIYGLKNTTETMILAWLSAD